MQATLTDYRKIEFPSAVVTIWPSHVETRFREDGSVSAFYPPVGKADFRAAATEMGYADPHQYGVEHDIAHHVVAEALGWPHSRSIWADAHGRSANPDGSPRPMPQRILYDEHLTNRLQRFVNTGKSDPWGALEHEFGASLGKVARRFLRHARPWLAPI